MKSISVLVSSLLLAALASLALVGCSDQASTVFGTADQVLQITAPAPGAADAAAIATSVVAPPAPVVNLEPITVNLLSGLPISKDAGATLNVTTPGVAAGDLGLTVVNNELKTTNNATLAAGANTLSLTGGNIAFGGTRAIAPPPLVIDELSVLFTVFANGTWTLPSAFNVELKDNGQGQYVLTGTEMTLSWAGAGVVAPADATVTVTLLNASNAVLATKTKTEPVVNNAVTFTGLDTGVKFNGIRITLDVQ
jgi:hypothetical protein